MARTSMHACHANVRTVPAIRPVLLLQRYGWTFERQLRSLPQAGPLGLRQGGKSCNKHSVSDAQTKECLTVRTHVREEMLHETLAAGPSETMCSLPKLALWVCARDRTSV